MLWFKIFHKNHPVWLLHSSSSIFSLRCRSLWSLITPNFIYSFIAPPFSFKIVFFNFQLLSYFLLHIWCGNIQWTLLTIIYHCFLMFFILWIIETEFFLFYWHRVKSSSFYKCGKGFRFLFFIFETMFIYFQSFLRFFIHNW